MSLKEKLKKAISKSISSEELSNLVNTADRRRSNGSYDEAIEYYTKALKYEKNLKKKELGNIYFKRGCNYIILRQYEKAIQDFSRAIELEPTIIALEERASIYQELHKYSEATTDILRAMRLRTTPKDYDQEAYDANFSTPVRELIGCHDIHASLYNHLGCLYLEQEKREEAIENFKKALDLDPGFWSARQSLAHTRGY